MNNPAMPSPLPPGVPRAHFIPDPVDVARKAEEHKVQRSDKLEATAIEVLKLALDANKGHDLTAKQLADYAELLWRWTTTDNWELPGDKA